MRVQTEPSRAETGRMSVDGLGYRLKLARRDDTTGVGELDGDGRWLTRRLLGTWGWGDSSGDVTRCDVASQVDYSPLLLYTPPDQGIFSSPTTSSNGPAQLCPIPSHPRRHARSQVRS